MTSVIALKKHAQTQSLAARLGLDTHEGHSTPRATGGMTAEPRLRLCLFGGPTLWIGKRELAIKNRKAGAIIAYLALSPGMRDSRDRLAGLLWSEVENSKARASLRQTLHVARAALQSEGLGEVLPNGADVRLDSAALQTDLDQAMVSINSGDPLDFLLNDTCVTDTLLAECDDLDPSYVSWVRCKRESVRQRLVRSLEDRLSDRTLATTAARRVAHALFQLDPINEGACRGLMRALVELGNTAGALAAYAKLWRALEEHFDIEPSATTQHLAVAIKSGTYRANSE
jgi:DNA-binding SARP family transcriptional activator